MTETEPVTQVRWGNDDKGVLYIAPLSFVAFVFGVSVFVWSFIVVLQEDFLDQWLKKYALLLLLPTVTVIWAWFARGTFLVVWELLTKFIVHNGYIEAGTCRVRGYYFRRAEFHLADIARIDKLVFDKPRWSMLTDYGPNYRITLHDGRTFYLSGWLDDADGFAAALGYREATE